MTAWRLLHKRTRQGRDGAAHAGGRDTALGAAAYRGSLEKATYVSCEVYLVAESNLSREEMEVRFEAWEKQLCEGHGRGRMHGAGAGRGRSAGSLLAGAVV